MYFLFSLSLFNPVMYLKGVPPWDAPSRATFDFGPPGFQKDFINFKTISVFAKKSEVTL